MDQFIPKLALSESTIPGQSTASVVRKVVELAGGLEPLITSGSKVLIKCLVTRTDSVDGFITVSPQIIIAVAEMVRELGGEPLICGTALFGQSSEWEVLQLSGLKKIADTHGFKLVNLSASGVEEVKIRDRSYWVCAALRPADVVLNLTFPYTDPMGRIQGTLDSLIHFQPGFAKEKAILESGANSARAEVLADLLAIRSPDLNIVEITPEYPVLGEKGVLLCCSDSVAIDSALGKLLSDNGLIDRAACSATAGLGFSALEAVDLVGDWHLVAPGEKSVNASSAIRNLFRRFSWSIVSPLADMTIRVNGETCNGCRECANSCQVGAMNWDHNLKLPIIDRSRCCHCFSCRENCPNGTISVRKSRASDWLSNSWRRNCAV